jgi:hypothetical protein
MVLRRFCSMRFFLNTTRLFGFVDMKASVDLNGLILPHLTAIVQPELYFI